MVICQRPWQVAAALRSVERDCVQQTVQGPSNTSEAAFLHKGPVVNLKHLERETGEFARRCVDIGNEIFNRIRLTILQIELPRVDQTLKSRLRGVMAANGGSQRCNDGMVAGRALINTLDCLAPPLQPDLPQHGFGHDFANLCDFQIEGIKGIERAPRLPRYTGANRVTIAIELPQLVRAIGNCLIDAV